MHLKRLKLRNFKSFAGATEIPFAPGFTGVAGPNGMGKSNISDAILFVLGPTSSKALRADRLTHLFFNGGASKRPASECEVALVFDNQDRMLPLEADEVEVTRYVKLAPSDPNGYYSYFYVNGRRTTQGEIDSLLAHGRLSGDGYNLVQQGDVNRIVSMGPVPRRGLVERLAGISQYDEELARAAAKRSDLETNLDRISVLLTEIRSHLSSLESQRLQALQYKQLQDERRRAEAHLARAGHRIAEQEVATCERHLGDLRTEVEALRKAVSELESLRDEATAKIDAIEADITRQGGAEAAKFKSELDARRMAFARADAAVTQASEELRGFEARLNEFSAILDADSKEAKRAAAEEAQLSRQLTDSEAAVKSQTDALAQATRQAEHSQGKLVGARKEVLEGERRREELQKRWEKAVQSLEESKAALNASERAQAQAEDDQRTREIELKDLELRARQSRVETGRKGASTADLEKELIRARNLERTSSEEASRLAQELMELNRRYMALDARIKARVEGGARASPLAAVDFLLSQRNLGKLPGIRGTVEELARLDPESQTALQVAAGGRFQALVVETDQVAEECIKILRAERRGRATFLPLNKMLPGRPHGKSLVVSQAPGSKGFAIDLINFDEELRPAFWYVFGETVVMDDLAHARAQMGGVRLVTLTGELIEATGAISGGYIDLAGKGPGGDSTVELKRLGQELREKSAAEAAVRGELAQLEEKVRSLVQELTKRSAHAEALSSTGRLIDQELAAARERLKEAKRRVETAALAKDKAAAAWEDSDADARKLNDEIASVKSSLSKLQEAYLSNLPGSLSAKIRSLQEAAQQAQAAHLAHATQLESARGALAAANKTLGDHRSESALATKTRATKERQLVSLKRQQAESRSALDALKALETKQLEAVRGQAEKKRSIEEGRLKVVQDLARREETLRTRVAMTEQQEGALATARHRLQEVEAVLKDLPAEGTLEPPKSVDELKRTIATLSSQLDAMGSVNLRALEEYDAEKARLDDFESEVKRLASEKKELLRLVDEVEKKKRERLIEVVISVNDHFKQVYGELSGGGDGEIALEIPSDPLSGGLLIRARPVGKVVQRLEQLSGGEKSLASLAFVFALQHHDPSPLYVFDEVDMSLDAVNAENVGRMLRRNAEKAQFVVISLRKVTLKFAHQLFGVTMRGDGCSHVVSLKLDEIVDVDERDRAEIPPPMIAPGAA